MISREGLSALWKKEDWWAVWIGFAILAFAAGAAMFESGVKVARIQRWTSNPWDAFYGDVKVKVSGWPQKARSATALRTILPGAQGRQFAERFHYRRKVSYSGGERKVSETIAWKSRYPMSPAERDALLRLADSEDHRSAVNALYQKAQSPKPSFLPLAALLFAFCAAFAVAIRTMGGRTARFVAGFLVVFALASVAYVLAGQHAIKAYGLPYAMWALVLGLLISNTVGTPGWLLAGSRTELFIKTGLVLLGAEILFSKILVLGSRGLLVAWLVTPCVLMFMYFFGTRVLRITSKALVVIVAAATSVCGVSAAIATAAAAKAKKEELTLAVGMTLVFTVLMMIFMPPLIKAVGLNEQVGGAWIGGTIDATGAVVAAGALLGDHAEVVAAVVKMIQNVLIGVVAFVVAVAWVTQIERDSDAPRPTVMEIWYRFPKFIIGFVVASLVFSFVLIPAFGGGQEGLTFVSRNVIGNVTKTCRGWLFCLAFVAIGLESNFRELAHQMAGGKPIVLYLVGQIFNLMLTLLVAYVAFGGWLLPAITL